MTRRVAVGAIKAGAGGAWSPQERAWIRLAEAVSVSAMKDMRAGKDVRDYLESALFALTLAVSPGLEDFFSGPGAYRERLSLGSADLDEMFWAGGLASGFPPVRRKGFSLSRCKPVVCEDTATGREVLFWSAKQASALLHVRAQNISALVATGGRTGKGRLALRRATEEETLRVRREIQERWEEAEGHVREE